LIRNVLAAEQHGMRFCLLCDARRPDLIRKWRQVIGAVRGPALRARCSLVLWQELVAIAPAPLQGFLIEKYGLLI
jgi:hypothetical protein